MGIVGNGDYWEYYDAEVSRELFYRLLEESKGFFEDDPKKLKPGEPFLVFWRSTARFNVFGENHGEEEFLCALLTPANISTGVTDKMTFTNPVYDEASNSFTLHRGFMNVAWFIRRVI